MQPVMSMLPGTWNDIRPRMKFFSPVSGWNALSTSCLARQISSSPIVGCSPARYSSTVRLAASSSSSLASTLSGFVVTKKCLARPAKELWSQRGSSRFTRPPFAILTELLLVMCVWE